MSDLEELLKKLNLISNDLFKLFSRMTAFFIQELPFIVDRNNLNYSFLNEEKLLQEIVSSNDGLLPDELIREVFFSILKYASQSTDSYRKLLVNSCQEGVFKSLKEMFDIPCGFPMIIAGPCAVENIEYMDEVARALVKCNIKFIRGGAYKPRTSPYDFQGLKEQGLKIASEVSKRYNLIFVTEVVDTRDVELIMKYTDILQIGARNMQNYELLKEVGKTNRPVILKRGMSATIREFLFAAEYIALEGNRNIILCERGIRTFETETRNTLDISCIPIIKHETNLPIIVDLSHSLGRKDIINPIAKSVLASGADGIMVEVHPKPEYALSDCKQQLSIHEFMEMMNYLEFNKITHP
jgi:3-deoxy-7-phosphoheptulonate synthase / chorismate mutase